MQCCRPMIKYKLESSYYGTQTAQSNTHTTHTHTPHSTHQKHIRKSEASTIQTKTLTAIAHGTDSSRTHCVCANGTESAPLASQGIHRNPVGGPVE